jgi:hypothetical protein
MSNLIKLAALCVALLVVLAISAGLFVTNLISVDTALELLNTEKRPIEHFPVVGPVLRALAPQATLSNWLALVIAGLMFVGTFVAFHYVYKIIHLLLDIRIYRHASQPELVTAAVDMIGRDLVILFPVVACMVGIVLGDLYLFTYARLAAAVNIDDPVSAAQEIALWRDIVPNDTLAASVWFATVVGPKMYLSTSLLAAGLVEVVIIKIGQVWNRVWTSLMAFVRPQTGAVSQDAEPARELFGYDANGLPVFDSETSIAYDVDQRPVGSSVVLSHPIEQSAGETLAQAAVTPFPAADERAPVIGGGPGETMSVAQALQQPDGYHVERATRRVYQRAYWDALNPDDDSINQSKSAEAA